MTTYVTFQHERSGELRSIKVGWSWTLFLFSQLWGIPLFLRQMFDWAMIMVILSALSFIFMLAGEVDETSLLLGMAIGCVVIGISVYMGLRGNELTARQMLRQGWIFADPSDAASVHARRTWSLA